LTRATDSVLYCEVMALSEDVLRYRPDLSKPIDRSEQTEERRQRPPSVFDLRLAPSVAVFVERMSQESPIFRLARIKDSAEKTVDRVLNKAIPYGGVRPSLKMKKSEENRYAALALSDGSSMSSMLVPYLREMADVVNGSNEIAEKLNEFLPINRGDFVTLLYDKQQAGPSVESSLQIVGAAVSSGLSAVADSLEGMILQMEAITDSPALHILLGAFPEQAIQALAGDEGLRAALAEVLADGESVVTAQAAVDLARRRRFPIAPVLSLLGEQLPNGLKANERLLKMGVKINPYLEGLSSIAYASASHGGEVQARLQSGIGDLHRIGALMSREWSEYTQSIQSRYRLNQIQQLLVRVDQADPADPAAWIAQQPDLQF
jgi:hypothetical protein